LDARVTSFVFAAVLFAALCHAGWNALIKGGLDPLATTTLITFGWAAVALILLPFAGMPDSAAWPWLIASSVVHLFYFAGLIESYRTGDLSQIYPIARGAAPLMMAVGERLSALGWCGIGVLVVGVMLLSMRGARDVERLDLRSVGFALFTAITICAYSIIDGIGARLSSNAPAYSLGLFLGIACLLGLYAFVRSGGAVLKPLGASWRSGLIGGAMQVFSYTTALWDDARADRTGCGFARNQRAVRGRHRGDLARRALAIGARVCRAADRLWADFDKAAVTPAYNLRSENSRSIRARSSSVSMSHSV
jgi:drug/metabolite transporter (DMT)-like permease